MNITNYSQLKYLLRSLPFIKSRFSLQSILLPLDSKLKNQCQNEMRCFLQTSNQLLAGHSKWQNIKNIKAATDRQKNLLHTKYAVLIYNACKEGECDPVFNATLAKVINEAKSHQVPVSVIERAINNSKKRKIGGKPALLTYSTPGGHILMVDVHTDNLNRTRQQINNILKKIGFKEVQRHLVEFSFEEKGVIVTQGDLEKAVDHAIEVGAEDVTEEDSCLTFVCSPTNFYSVKKAIEDLKYNIDYADVDRVPMVQHSIQEAELERLRETLEKIEGNDDVVKVSSNIAI